MHKLISWVTDCLSNKMNATFARRLHKFIQHIRGEKVFECLSELEQTQWYPVEKLKDIQWKKIKAIITHAYDNVPYYRQKFDEHGINPNKIKDLSDLKYIPILTKKELRENAPRLIAKDRKYRFSQDVTSGSSGPVTTVFTDRNAAAFQHAAVFRAYRWMGLDIGDKIARFWGTQLDVKRKIKDLIKDFLLNRITFSTHFLDDKTMFSYYQKLKNFKPRAIYGFTSAIYEFAQFIFRNELPIKNLDIKTIITTGELLFSYQRQVIEKTFNCRVYNEYGCAEFGPIAYECPHGNLHIMAENLYVEIENQTDDGRGELIITELNNFVMPLIRYKLGDIGIVSYSKCTCGRELPVLKEISGRALDFVKTPDGRVIHGIYFDYLPKYFLGEIRQFQIVQEEIHTICVNIVKDSGFNKHTLQKFEKKLREVVGTKVDIIFEFKEAIPRENTGKFHFVISKLP